MLSWTIPIAGHHVEVRSTTVDDGDFAVPGVMGPTVADHSRPLPEVESRARELDRQRATIVDRPWTWVRQVHGTDVLVVDGAGVGAGSIADAVVTTTAWAPIAVTTADCSPVVLISSVGVAVVHAGWRGALGGVIEAASERLLAEGGAPVSVVLGPCISAAHYAFGGHDLAQVEAEYGPLVRGVTADGAAALDMAAVVAAACVRGGFPAPEPTACTAGPQFFSHRVRADRGRQTTVAWLEPVAT